MRIPTPEEFPSHPGGQCTLALARDSKPEWKQGTLFLVAHFGCDHQRIAATAKRLNVGELPSRGSLYDEVDQAVRNVHADHPQQVWVYRCWCLLITILLPTTLVLAILTGNRVVFFVWGFANISYAFNIFHTRLHRGRIVYGIQWLDKLTHPLYEVLDRTFMVRPEAWMSNHNDSHHLETNQLMDDDVQGPLQAGFRVTEQCPYQHNFHHYQHIYTHLLLSLSLFSFPIVNFVERRGSIVFLLLHYTLIYGLPWYLHQDWSVIQTAIMVQMVVGSLIGYLFQVSHNHEDLGKFRDNYYKGATQDIDQFILHEMTESISWGGYWSTILVGGINYQIEHHVAPCLCPVRSLLLF